MISVHAPDQFQHVCARLASAGLIRLVSEIDDHGAIPPRALARTLTDLAPHHIRQAVEQAESLGLLDRSHSGLGLTTAGKDLADFYDHAARWARQHNYPARTCDFTSRIRRTLALLDQPAVREPRLQDGDAAAELRHVHRLLAEWADTHQLTPVPNSYGVAA
ncbi:hypothetical protein ACIF80_36095 [Streptomyces sp. NPDC085927]|uniref:hypothetical protein n=1 Tax=Streptomyces sp. NPDC085927 TaxID=3365738 RepID=UPI0037CE3FFB